MIDSVEIPAHDEWDALGIRPSADEPWKQNSNHQSTAGAVKRCTTLNPEHLSGLNDLIHFVQNHPKEAYPRRNIERLIGSQRSPGLDARITQEALENTVRCCADEGLLSALKQENLDAFVFPNVHDFLSTCAARAGSSVFAVPLGFPLQGIEVKNTFECDQIDIAPNIP